MSKNEVNELAAVILMCMAWDQGYRKGYDYGWCQRDEGKPHKEDLKAADVEGTAEMAARAAYEILHE